MRKRWIFTFFGLGLLLISSLEVGVAQQSFNDFAEVATGYGRLTWDGGERFRIDAVAVFLRKDGEAEICLLNGRQNFYAGGRWVENGGSVELVITDDTRGGCAIGWGTVFLREGCVPIAGLTMTMKTVDGPGFAAQFVAQNGPPCPTP